MLGLEPAIRLVCTCYLGNRILECLKHRHPSITILIRLRLTIGKRRDEIPPEHGLVPLPPTASRGNDGTALARQRLDETATRGGNIHE